MNIYVSNLGFNVKDDDLKKLFATYGEVVSAKIITNRETGQSRGFGFVEMGSKDDAEKAMVSLNNSQVEGRTISVNEARAREGGANRNFS